MTQIPTWSDGPVNPTNGRAAPGAVIGSRYALRAAVGHGGMGTVWRASDTLLRRDVAVKEVVLPPGLAPSDRDAMYERTLREARAAAALQHPAVVQVYDVVTDGGRPWIVMELLDARSLADIVIEDGPMAPRAVAKIGIALLGALEVAHANGVLHRDVKPANVLICSDGRCVLTDFGVARMPTDVQLTTPGMVLGSPHFISPERAMGREFGPPSDLFSLGVTLYTAVEGRPPFDRGDPIETMHAVVEDPPAPPVRSGPLTEVLFGLLEKDPAQRYDVHAARAKLRELLAGPLASKAPVHQMTDPYAVVRGQQSPWQPPAATPQQPKPTGKIGGRAMLAPGESLTDRLAEIRRQQATGQSSDPGRPTSPSGTTPSSVDLPTGAMPQPSGLDVPTGAMAAPAGAAAAPTGIDQPTEAMAAPTSPAAPSGTAIPGGHGHSGTADAGTVVLPSANAGPYPVDPGQQFGNQANRFGPPSSGNTGNSDSVQGRILTSTPQGNGNLINTIRNWPRKVQLAAAGGLTAVLLIGATLLFNDSDPEPAAPVQVAQTPSPAATFETKTHSARGISVNVPKDWRKSGGTGVWIDFTDPVETGRKVRILVEPASASTKPLPFLEAAGDRLANNSRSCDDPYQEISLTEVEVAGRDSAELEYTCGTGDDARHGIWRAVVYEKKVYSFYLTTPEAIFAESRPVFDEMVRSFQLTAAS